MYCRLQRMAVCASVVGCKVCCKVVCIFYDASNDIHVLLCFDVLLVNDQDLKYIFIYY